uniref:Uncharacterized protein n=1 Tax=Anguilla anguilla TaxID=7936 RepID=A0A0E9QNM3_ANGAN
MNYQDKDNTHKRLEAGVKVKYFSETLYFSYCNILHLE